MAITGVGAVTPSGSTAPDLWQSVLHGRSGVTLLPAELTAGLSVRVGGLVGRYTEATGLPAPVARRLSPVQRWAIAAADEALADAGVDRRIGSLPWDPHRLCIIVATGSGPVDTVLQAASGFRDRGPRQVSPALVVFGTADATAGILSQRCGARGATQAVVAACASGAVGIGEGMRRIRHGYADAVLVVGMDDCMNPVHLAANANLRSLATGYADDPASASRPFDRSRSGFVMSQGAGAVLLEAENSARRRGARPQAVASGFGDTSDAHHPTAPHPDGNGAAAAIRACLADAGVSSDQVDHVNTHGTGTLLGDRAEIAALGHALGERAHSIPLTATKSSTGHLLGASGVIETIIAVMTLRDQQLPPTINLNDAEFGDWDFVRDLPRRHATQTVLSNSFGFGGHNAALLLTTA
ncbi:beta-ketoacyl-[acyl-carrier-protein] synthase family protein [Microbacterium aurantiacum]|uniref:beta-ketoacyl-[acyl-carrier-protein] synthase family protein n=1 Tax=Microbacterium aurantiacum TaxID=162393 RepID=UPI001FEB13E6|nr:beta-ketoacyl-[acyl-carrier-protein] synthase family protein [Microbacterium aurantiacum]